MWADHHGFFPFPGIIFLFIFIAVICRLFFFRGRFGYFGGRFDNRREAERILMERLARGEIDEEEYRRIRDILYK